MADREKVIKALTCCVFPVSKGFPYQSHIADEGCEVDECPYRDNCDQMLLDALELLKESRQTEWERDTAVDQLTQIGKSIGEQMNDIVLLLEKQRVSRGRWERLTGMAPPEYHGHKVCSVCGCMAPHHPIHIAREELPKYCPGCGALMEGEEQ